MIFLALLLQHTTVFGRTWQNHRVLLINHLMRPVVSQQKTAHLNSLVEGWIHQPAAEVSLAKFHCGKAVLGWRFPLVPLELLWTLSTAAKQATRKHWPLMRHAHHFGTMKGSVPPCPSHPEGSGICPLLANACDVETWDWAQPQSLLKWTPALKEWYIPYIQLIHASSMMLPACSKWIQTTNYVHLTRNKYKQIPSTWWCQYSSDWSPNSPQLQHACDH